jgi:hypothetical protein
LRSLASRWRCRRNGFRLDLFALVVRGRDGRRPFGLDCHFFVLDGDLVIVDGKIFVVVILDFDLDVVFQLASRGGRRRAGGNVRDLRRRLVVEFVLVAHAAFNRDSPYRTGPTARANWTPGSTRSTAVDPR